MATINQPATDLTHSIVETKGNAPIIKDVEQLKANLKEEKRARSIDQANEADVKTKNQEEEEECRKRRKVNEVEDSDGEIIDGPIAKVDGLKQSKVNEGKDVVDTEADVKNVVETTHSDDQSGPTKDRQQQALSSDIPEILAVAPEQEKIITTTDEVKKSIEDKADKSDTEAHDVTNKTEPINPPVIHSSTQDPQMPPIASSKEDSKIPKPDTAA